FKLPLVFPVSIVRFVIVLLDIIYNTSEELAIKFNLSHAIKINYTCALLEFFYCRRWGETETEKCPGDIFPVEPTDEVLRTEETLNPGFKGLLGVNTKKPAHMSWFSCVHAEDGTFSYYI
ncbi:hypothetical protein, partial [Butyrivibrio sp. XPD2002]|uniref:hypothetical protein n=1 Tax=Butyrivibrio sp. XPD2002 TaxID=1280665 RepID=UPI00055C80A0